MTSHGVWYSYHIQTLVEVHILARYMKFFHLCTVEGFGRVWPVMEKPLGYLFHQTYSSLGFHCHLCKLLVRARGHLPWRRQNNS